MNRLKECQICGKSVRVSGPDKVLREHDVADCICPECMDLALLLMRMRATLQKPITLPKAIESLKKLME
jgi:hypothetical protein